MNHPGPAAAPDRDQTRRLPLGTREGAVQQCRDFSRRALLDWQWPAVDRADRPDDEQVAVFEDVLLMVSELVTNACLHTPGGPRELRLRWDTVRLRVEVSDASPFPPELRPSADRGQPGGHGLRVVDRLARAWGSRPEDGGKSVWLEVSSPLEHRP
ncbi:ATP-binding protein [Kitasatospora purpeofusca]|uniref:ATP-binding protein n=1 Tax=Kitasatospora purpeofusca TaxID=67352 RepID=A0ABZ1UAP4_9ACTN|nr:ATP-binding protein [Kitasatospora purpeofusca]